jgi:2-polyprenyl-6-methoxyphenol hydroxylase-like FAD-dependent oxidoreductase
MKTMKADVVVIGGGVIGAYASLRKNPNTMVSLQPSPTKRTKFFVRKAQYKP